MTRTVERLMKLALGIFVAAALGFGASELRASAAANCPFNPDNGQLGTCVDQAECQGKCDLEYGTSTPAICDPGGCCTCVVR